MSYIQLNVKNGDIGGNIPWNIQGLERQDELKKHFI